MTGGRSLSRLFSNYRPRITQAYIEVTYRTVTASTVYIGGVYEKSFAPGHAQTGRTAMRSPL